MGKYTVLENNKVDDIINGHLDLIKDTLLEKISGIEAVFLVGGFGRGEGGVLISDDKITPVNDYDIEIIIEKIPERNHLEGIEKELARKIGISFVHIECHLRNELIKTKLTIYFYDLKYGSIQLYGDKKILSLIPDFSPSDIKLSEGFNILLTRIKSIILAYNSLVYNIDKSEDIIFFGINQLSKAILACIDANLILKHSYHHLYSRRIKLFKELYPNVSEKFKSAAEWAIRFKLHPNHNDKADFFSILSIYKNAFIMFMAFYFHLPNKIIKMNITFWLLYHPKIIIKRLYLKIIKRNNWFEEFLSKSKTGLEIMESFSEESINKTIEDKIKKYIEDLI